jgi:alcohol-forming fatty acyl-CoA reductase
MENLGIPIHERKMIIENVNIIINSAASVNFDDPMKTALSINYFGASLVLDLSKECRHLLVFTDISTCYVNCIKTGLVKEEIYNPNEDVGKVVEGLMKEDENELKENL